MRDLVQINDEVFESLVADLEKVGKYSLHVGFPEGESPASGKLATMSEVATIAAFNEFGTANSPERSFIRSTYDEKEEDIFAFMKDQYERTITSGQRFGPFLSRPTETLFRRPKLFYDRLGVYTADLIKEKIRDLSTPPNAPSTIRIKGSSNPLIHNGQMLASVTHSVVRRKG